MLPFPLSDGASIGLEANTESLDRLPDGLQEPFRQLCTLAFSGVLEDRVTFSSTDLEALGIRTDVAALGLVQAVPSLVSSKMSVYYNFLHLLIQELLTAYYISSMSGSDQISHFQNYSTSLGLLQCSSFMLGSPDFSRKGSTSARRLSFSQLDSSPLESVTSSPT